MPSRILKESICTSESLAYLSAEAEVLFYRFYITKGTQEIEITQATIRFA